MSVRDDPVLFLQQGKAGDRGGGTAMGGNAITTTKVHKLDGPEHAAADDTTTLDATIDEHGLLPKLSGDVSDALRGDGTWGMVDVDTSEFELRNEGGQDDIQAHGSMGSTETIDPTDGNVHTGTLNANVTYTLNPPAGTGACEIEFERTGSGGPWTETWPGSVTWLGGVAPTPPTSGNSGIVILRSLDGGTNWLGIAVGGSGTVVAALDDLTDATITSPASGDRLRYNGSMWVNANLHDEPMIASDGSIQTDGLLNPQMHEVAW